MKQINNMEMRRSCEVGSSTMYRVQQTLPVYCLLKISPGVASI